MVNTSVLFQNQNFFLLTEEGWLNFQKNNF
jgi:hypothetical protein